MADPVQDLAPGGLDVSQQASCGKADHSPPESRGDLSTSLPDSEAERPS